MTNCCNTVLPNNNNLKAKQTALSRDELCYAARASERLTSGRGPGGHEDVHVGEDPDPELEVLVVPGDVLRAADLDGRFRNRHDVNVEAVVLEVDGLAGGAVQGRGQVDEPPAGGGELARVEVRHLLVF